MKFVNAQGHSYFPTSFLSYNDVLLRPQSSRFDSRNSKDISTSVDMFLESGDYFPGFSQNFNIPIISANMDTVTGPEMAIKMGQLGGLGILHRFYKNDDDYIKDIIHVHNQLKYVAFSVGVGQGWTDFLNRLKNAVNSSGNYKFIICLDVAHGHMNSAVEMVKKISLFGDFNIQVFIIAGNVATAEGARDLEAAGAHAIKVGTGSGAVCSTRIVTGHGVPQLSAIMEVRRSINDKTMIIADGGIRTSGDIVKALAAGANFVMLGKVLAGHEECPGEIVHGHKIYRGQSSRHFMNDIGKTGVAAEGEAVKIRYKGFVENSIKEIVGGIRSGMTYSGAGSIHELQKRAEFIEITNHGWVESTPHAIGDGNERI